MGVGRDRFAIRAGQVQGGLEQGHRTPVRPDRDAPFDVADGPYAQPGQLRELFLGKPSLDPAQPDDSTGSAQLPSTRTHVGTWSESYSSVWTTGFWQPGAPWRKRPGGRRFCR